MRHRQTKKTYACLIRLLGSAFPPSQWGSFSLQSCLIEYSEHEPLLRFRAAKTGIMFSSDVSARGVDYPRVTLVVQVCVLVKDGGGVTV